MSRLLLMWGLHFLCDFPLQGDFLAKGKNLSAPIPGVPWMWPMTAHCAIHALAVGLVTGKIYLALAEFVLHFCIDVAKCKGKFGFTVDQILHLACKVLWAV